MKIEYELPDVQSVIRYALLNSDGVVIGTGYSVTVEEMLGSCPPGCSVEGLADDEFPDPMGAFMKNGELHRLPSQPEPFHSWNLEKEEWEDRRTEEQKTAATAFAWEQFRAERDKRLAASDWADTLSAERRLAPEVFEAWAIYRQALRDMPLTTEDPHQPNWPVSP